MQVQLIVTVSLDRLSGKFAPKDDIVAALISELERADPGQIDDLGADGDSTYEVTEWVIDEK